MAYKDDVIGSVPCLIRLVLVNWNGGDVNTGIYDANMPETGTVFRITTSKPNLPGDQLTFNSPVVSIAKQDEIPHTFYLKQNYPNPFNPLTQINFGLAKNTIVKLEVF